MRVRDEDELLLMEVNIVELGYDGDFEVCCWFRGFDITMNDGFGMVWWMKIINFFYGVVIVRLVLHFSSFIVFFFLKEIFFYS
jgi:hypothetical protein